jgi:glycosyltransferase involved in cell wall biosynthesis
MRVALNLEQLLQPAPGGVGRYTAKLARLLPGVHDEAGDAIDLVAFVARHPRARVRAALREFDLGGLEPVIAPLPRPLLYDSWHVLGFPALRHLGRSLRDLDVVHAPSVAVPPRGDAPLVVTAHDAAPLLFPETYPRRGRWFHERGLAAAAARTDLVVTVSYAAADELVAHTAIAPDRIRVVPNGVDLEVAGDDDVARVRDAFGLDDRPYLLWAGSLEPRKNVGTLARAFSAWAATTAHDHRLVLAGPPGWVEDEAATLAPLQPLGERVRTIGRVDEAVLRGLYRGADLFLFPSRHEGFGLPVLEAMAQGTAVVCADIPALREVADDAARRLPVDDVGAWSDAIEELLSDDGARAALARAGVDRAQAFSWERCAAATAAVYREARRANS